MNMDQAKRIAADATEQFQKGDIVFKAFHLKGIPFSTAPEARRYYMMAFKLREQI